MCPKAMKYFFFIIGISLLIVTSGYLQESDQTVKIRIFGQDDYITHRLKQTPYFQKLDRSVNWHRTRILWRFKGQGEFFVGTIIISSISGKIYDSQIAVPLKKYVEAIRQAHTPLHIKIYDRISREHIITIRSEHYAMQADKISSLLAQLTRRSEIGQEGTAQEELALLRMRYVILKNDFAKTKMDKEDLKKEVKRLQSKVNELKRLIPVEPPTIPPTEITLGEPVSDRIDAAAGDGEDWYRFFVEKSEGEIKISLINQSARERLNLILYDNSGQRCQSRLVTQQSNTIRHPLHLSGNFVLCIGAAQRHTTTDYQLLVEYVPLTDQPPAVQILSPRHDELTQDSQIEVELEVDDDRGIESVTVNDSLATREPNGHYVAIVKLLKDGPNRLSATARDTNRQYGNDEVEIRVDLPRRLGLVIGVKEYRYFPQKNLKYSDSDAQKIVRSLQKHSFDIPKERKLVKSDATRSNVIGKIAELQSLATLNDIVFIYFSGHGVRGRYDCLVTHDARENETHNLLPNTVIGTDELREGLNLINAGKTIVVLDSCYSGGAMGNDSAMRWRPISPSADANFPSRTVMIASSNGNQPSWESDQLQSGIFTHYFVEVLNDELIADTNKDGTTTLGEIERYLKEYVSEQSSTERKVKQIPIVKPQQSVWLSQGLFEK